jgi:hypothetical protein
MNPFDALAEFALGKIKEGIWAQWLKFLFEIVFSAVASFLFSCGTLLFAKAPAGIAIGFGMIWAAMAMVYLFRRETSRLTKGMLIALPSEEAVKEMNSDFQMIQKPEKDQEKKQ